MTNNLFSNVKRAMLLLGYEVLDRGIPSVIIGDGDCYMPERHVVQLRDPLNKKVMAHEFCHSLQADVSSPVYYREDGSIDPAKWMSDAREVEAQTVELIAHLVTGEKIDAWVTLIRESGQSANLADWLVWLSQGKPHAEKPHPVARKARRAFIVACATY